MDQAKPPEQKKHFFFQKGNKYAKGRKPFHMSTPDIILPHVFHKGHVTWGADFMRLYRKQRGNQLNGYKGEKLTELEQILWKSLLDLLPYLVSRITLKEIDLKKITDPLTSASQARMTQKMLQELEKDSLATKPGTTPNSDQSSMGNGAVVLSPATQSTDTLPEPK